MRTATVLLLLSAGCSSSAGEPPPAEAATGGESTAPPGAVEPPPPEPEPAADPASLLPTTVPIPIPQPAVPRTQMSAALRRIWERVEQAIEIRPPSPPAEASEEAIDAWAGGPFRQWFEARSAAMNAVSEAIAALGRRTPRHEIAVAAALLGYAYEDMAAGVRGAPVPEALAADAELLDVYVRALTDATAPMARDAARGYAHCVRTFGEAEAAAWSEWADYCDERGAEVVEVYDLSVEPPPP
jgi:hypothetical protein